METSLDQVRPGMRAVVTRLDVEPHLQRRLRDFGMIPGTTVQCSYHNPWGDVTALRLRGTVLAMRTRDLRKIQVHWE